MRSRYSVQGELLQFRFPVAATRYNLQRMSAYDSTPANAGQVDSARGRLNISRLASGVGKSFRMFDEARRRKERGQDVVVGAPTPGLARGCAHLEFTRNRAHDRPGGCAGIDVPAILRRHPQVCLVDGLAYDNPWNGNPHRWQDVEELLAHGINVIGSVNLQHIADQREEAEKLTGKRVTETIPREFLNKADEIVVVDRLPRKTRPELSALREMALVLSADVIDAGLQRYLRSHDIEPTSPTHERFLICLTSQANPDRMIASARLSAARFHCDVTAICVRPPNSSEEEHQAVERNLARAREAGARVEVLEGDDPVEAIVQYARCSWRYPDFCRTQYEERLESALWGTAASRLIRAAEGMDVRVFPH